MNKQLFRSVLSASVVTGLLLEPAVALAQLEEVIVTARKREESIMRVPVVATALSGELLNQYAIADLQGVADKVPGLNIGSQVLASGMQVTMRGIGTSTLNPAVDQSVALNVDGMQMTQGFAYRMAMFDMSQVEVLKGPQALFFGKASPAGVIAIRTVDPGEEFDFSARGGYEIEAEEAMTEMILSGPLTDTLGARLSGKYSDSDGIFENTAVPGSDPFAVALGDPSLAGRAPENRDYAANEYWMLRGTMLWNPSDRFDARLKLNYAQDDAPASASIGQLVSCPEGTDGLLLDFFGGTEDCKLDKKINILAMDPAYYPNIRNGGQPYTEADQYFGTLEWNYEVMEDISLTSVTGYYDIDVATTANIPGTALFGPAFGLNNDLERDDFTQELRLTSDFDGPLNFMAGGFYQDGTTDFFVELPLNKLIAPLAGPPYSSYISFATADHTIDAEALSFFGQVLWDIAPELELGAGVRWTDEERSHEVIDYTEAHLGVPPHPVDLAEPDINSDKWSPEVSLTYTPTDELTLFASVKETYKSGSFDVGGLPADGEKTSFDDERVRGGEAGIKSRWLGGRLGFNAAGYYYEFKDLQVERSDFDAATGRFLTHTVNAASAEVYGVDFDITFVPAAVEGLTLYGAANWNQAEYDEFEDAACWGGQTIAQGCDQLYEPAVGLYTAQDLSGEPLLRAPEWTVNFGFDYQMSVFDNMTLVIGTNGNYSSKYLMNALARDDMYQDSYTKFGASVALKGPDDGWEVAVIGDNLTDELVAGNCGLSDYTNAGLFGDVVTGGPTTGASGQNELACNVENGRALWIRLTLRPAALMNN